MPDPEHEPLETSSPYSAELAHSPMEPAADLSLDVSAPRPRQEVFPSWSAWDVAAVLAFTVAVIFLCSSVALGVAHVLNGKRHVAVGELAANPIVIIGSQIAAYPAVILFMISLVRSKSRTGFWRAIRWNWPRAAAPAFLVSGLAFALAVEFVSRYLPIPKSLPVDKYFSEITAAYLMAGFGITLAPLLEELFFRGMLYPLMRRTVGVTTAVLFTATTFGFIHGAQLGYAWAPLLSIFLVGAVFTLVREKTESVAASFLMHCGYNFALFATLWVGSDHFRHLEKMTN